MRSLSTALAFLTWLAVLSRFGTLADDDDDEDIDLEEDDEEEVPKKRARPKAEVEGTVIGIDLGTTFSCVAVMKESGVEIIPNDQGNRITPSYVSFTKNEGAGWKRLIGEAAKNEATNNPANTMFDVKRLLGRNFNDATVQEDMKTLPYKILESEGKLAVQAVSESGEENTMPPELISSIVLTKMKETAEAFLGKTVENAVITVPAYFSNSQREATRDAGKLAGLNVLRIINEPTAAALAYGLDKKDESSILVYDLGGGTFDVSLLTVAEGVIEVVATNGDTHLGGEDFDRRLAEYLQEVFEERSGKKIGDDKRAKHKLRQAAENAKIALSSAAETKVDIESLFEGVDFTETLNRAKFEELNSDLFKKTLLPVKQVLEDGKMKKDEVDEIVLVGGSTRIPKVQTLLKDFFNGKEPNSGLNPDEAVAVGAAVQGGILSGIAADDTVLLDITPISIGIETNGGIMDKMIPRNTAIPVEKTKSYVTSHPDTTETMIKIFEGERPLTKHNEQLGAFTLKGFPKAPAGLGHTVTLEVDVNGIMKVSAKITKSGLEEAMTITKNTNRLTQEQIDQYIKSEEETREEDAKELAHTKSKVAIQDLKRIAQWKKGRLPETAEEDERKVIDDCFEKLKPVEENFSAYTPEELDQKKSECESLMDPVFTKYAREIHKQSNEDAPSPPSPGGAEIEDAPEDDDDPDFDEEVDVDEDAAPAPAPAEKTEL